MNFYRITIQNDFDKIIFGTKKLEGFDITPRNSFRYEGIVVNRLVVINQLFIQKILKKRIKRKLELYLQFIIDFIDDDSDTGSSINEVLNDIKRYKEILMYRYNKYLDEKYIDMLKKKLEILEKEFTMKLYIIQEKQNEYEQENVSHRRR